MAEHGRGLVADISAAWRDPRGSIAARLAGRPRDAQLLAWALGAALIGFVAGLPEAVQQAGSTGTRDEATGVLASRLFGAVFITPLFLFVLAGLSHLIARLFGGQGSYWSARVALIWAVVVCVPLVLLNGIASAILPPLGVSVIALATLAGFGWIWVAFLSEVENFKKSGLIFGVIFGLPIVSGLFLTIFS